MPEILVWLVGVWGVAGLVVVLWIWHEARNCRIHLRGVRRALNGHEAREEAKDR